MLLPWNFIRRWWAHFDSHLDIKSSFIEYDGIYLLMVAPAHEHWMSPSLTIYAPNGCYKIAHNRHEQQQNQAILTAATENFPLSCARVTFFVHRLCLERSDFSSRRSEANSWIELVGVNEKVFLMTRKKVSARLGTLLGNLVAWTIYFAHFIMKCVYRIDVGVDNMAMLLNETQIPISFRVLFKPCSSFCWHFCSFYSQSKHIFSVTSIYRSLEITHWTSLHRCEICFE